MNRIPFEDVIKRKNTDCSKWDAVPFENAPEDVIPMWVADMDFACPPAVMDAIYKRMEHPVFGYMQLPKNFFSSIINWQRERYGATVEPEDIVPVASVLGGVAMAVQGLTQKGDAVLVPTPGYHAFYNAVVNNGRRLVTCEMPHKDYLWELDFHLLEQQIINEDVKLVLFCSPHNPTGRVWKIEELRLLSDICAKHGVPCVSDEIHADMTLGNKFSTIFSAGERASETAIALYAPTKTFNIAGLCTAYAVIKNQKLRDSFISAVLASGLKVKNTLGTCAMIGAYEGGAEWVDSLQEYLLGNLTHAVSYINGNLRGVRAFVPQATYFLWVDFSETGLSSDEIINRCVYEAGVAITRGTEFIAGGESFVRMNCACPLETLNEALTRLSRVFK